MHQFSSPGKNSTPLVNSPLVVLVPLLVAQGALAGEHQSLPNANKPFHFSCFLMVWSPLGAGFDPRANRPGMVHYPLQIPALTPLRPLVIVESCTGPGKAV